MRTLKFIIVLLILLPVGALCAMLFAPNYVDWNGQKPRLEKVIKSNSGYDVKLLGDIEIKVLPQPSFSLGGIEVKSFTDDQYIFTSKAIKGDLVLSELLSFTPVLKSLSVESPVVYLHQDVKEVANWQPKRLKRKSQSAAVSLEVLQTLGDVVFSNGEFVYENDLTGQRYAVKDIQVNIGTQGGETATAGIAALVNDIDVKMDLNANVANLNKVPFTANVTVAEDKIIAQGDLLKSKKGFTYSGSLNVGAAELITSLSDIFAIAPEQRIKSFPFSFNGQAVFGPEEISLQKMNLALGAGDDVANIEGGLSYTHDKFGKQDALKGVITTKDHVNLNTFGICQEVEDGAAVASATEDTTIQPWSEKQVDMTILQKTEAFLDVKLANVTCGKDTFDLVELLADAKLGKITLHNLRTKMGEGSALVSGHARVNNKNVLTADMLLKLRDMPFEAFAPAKFSESVNLPINLDSSLAFTGSSVSDWISSLNGEIKGKSQDLTLKGVPLNNMVLFAQTLFSQQQKSKAENKGELDAHFMIENGVMSTEKLIIKTSDVKISGYGKISLPHQTVQYRLTPIGLGKFSVSVPVSIKGSWSDLKIAPAFASPQGIGAGIGAAVGGPLGASIGAMVGTALDSNGSDPDEQAKAKDSLGGLITNGIGNLLGTNKNQ